MSVVLKPGSFRRDPHPVGKLAATLLSVAAAGAADPARFRRGKAYVAERAVLRIEITPGVLRAQVAGSRGAPYEVLIGVASVAGPADGSDPDAYRSEMTRLVPDSDELMATCTCPDDSDLCKHAVATVLALADELTSRPELVLAWRCADGPAVGRRRRGAGAESRVAVPHEPPFDPFATTEWRSFAGDVAAVPDAPNVSSSPVRWRSAIDVTGVEDLVGQMLGYLDRTTRGLP